MTVVFLATILPGKMAWSFQAKILRALCRGVRMPYRIAIALSTSSKLQNYSHFGVLCTIYLKKSVFCAIYSLKIAIYFEILGHPCLIVKYCDVYKIVISIFQEESEEESDDDMGFGLFD